MTEEGAPDAFELLRKYDRPGPRYTSYPTAVEFTDAVTEADYRRKLEEADRASSEPLSLYVHLPFCEARCTFCGCNVIISPDHDVSIDYLDHLHREIDLLAAHLPHRRRLSQYHWGGGTPTYQTVAQMRALHAKIGEHFELAPDAEAAIEVDPRVTSREQMDFLREAGFNRISMGVQDFTPAVQEAIDRHQTEATTRELYAYTRGLGFSSINLDLIYGLPLQTPEAFRKNMEVVLELRPDRVALYSYAYVPWVKASQKKLDTLSFPSAEIKLRLFVTAREMFLAAGYVQIGMDHFALPGDELAMAVAGNRLHRNFMGYTVRKGSDMVGVGVSAIGDVRGCFVQNVKKLPAYYADLDAGRFPVERGYLLSDDDRIRREVITRLMCNFHLDVRELERVLAIDFASYFAAELAELRAADGLVAHGFVKIAPDRLDVVGNGRLFLRNVCMTFDRYLRSAKPDSPVYSRTV